MAVTNTKFCNIPMDTINHSMLQLMLQELYESYIAIENQKLSYQDTVNLIGFIRKVLVKYSQSNRLLFKLFIARTMQSSVITHTER